MYYATSTRNRIADITLGLRVTRAAALVTAASVPIFTISGGRIVMTSLVGEVTIIIANTATLIHIDTAPTVGVATALSTDSDSIAQAAVGTKYTLPVTVGKMNTSTGAAVLDACPRWVLPIGTLNLHGSAAPATGTIKWTITYVPLDKGALVVAA